MLLFSCGWIALWQKILAVLLFVSGLLILVHQALTNSGIWFEFDQFLHHENIAAVIIAFACGILLSEIKKEDL